jgi:hypothetical protein
MICWVQDPLPLFLYAKGVGFIRRSESVITLTRPGLYLYLPNLQVLSIKYLLNHLGCWASWPRPLGRTGRLMVGPPILLFESSQPGTHGIKPRHKDLLTFLKDMLPQGNAVPDTIYDVKQIIYPLGLEVEKVHTCRNDCIIYHGAKYKDLEKCPICGLN